MFAVKHIYCTLDAEQGHYISAPDRGSESPKANKRKLNLNYAKSQNDMNVHCHGSPVPLYHLIHAQHSVSL